MHWFERSRSRGPRADRVPVAQELADEQQAIELISKITADEQLDLVTAQLRRVGIGPDSWPGALPSSTNSGAIGGCWSAAAGDDLVTGRPGRLAGGQLGSGLTGPRLRRGLRSLDTVVAGSARLPGAAAEELVTG